MLRLSNLTSALAKLKRLTSHTPDAAASLSAQEREKILLHELKAGNPQAVERWFKQYHHKLVSFVLTKISSEADAEELAQETFLSCMKHLPLFRGDSSIWTWMQNIARHEIADYYRKKYAKKAIKSLPLSDLLGNEDPADSHHTAEKVKTVFAQLKHDYQELLLLKYIDGKKVQEIATELGRSVKAVESDLFRARQEFKVLYAAQGVDSGSLV